MYPPREPNARRNAEQFPGEYGDRSYSTAISFKNSRKQFGTVTQQDSMDGSLDTSVRLIGTLKTLPVNQPDETDLVP